MIELKCKQCRKSLFNNDDITLLTSHNENMSDIEHTGCGNNFVEHLLYMSIENVPTWIEDIINQTSWTKGKLNCPFCNNRIGSYNLMVNTKCSCGKSITPNIRLIQSKLDILNENKIKSIISLRQASVAE